MLPSVSSLASNILAMPTTTSALTGMTNFVVVISAFMNQVQGGPLGTPGIFTLGNAAMITALAAMPPVADNSWIVAFANAMETGILTGLITPATVTNPAWLGSGNKDVVTLPSTVATILTIPLAKATLIAALASATASNNPPVPFAQAIKDCTMAFIFTCIGLGPPPIFLPTPIPTPAL